MANFISRSFEIYSTFTNREKIAAKIGTVTLALCGIGMIDGAINNYHGTDAISCTGSASFPIDSDITFAQTVSNEARLLRVSASDLQPILVSENDNNLSYSQSEGLHFIDKSGSYQAPTNCNN